MLFSTMNWLWCISILGIYSISYTKFSSVSYIHAGQYYDSISTTVCCWHTRPKYDPNWFLVILFLTCTPPNKPNVIMVLMYIQFLLILIYVFPDRLRWSISSWHLVPLASLQSIIGFCAFQVILLFQWLCVKIL